MKTTRKHDQNDGHTRDHLFCGIFGVFFREFGCAVGCTFFFLLRCGPSAATASLDECVSWSRPMSFLSITRMIYGFLSLHLSHLIVFIFRLAVYVQFDALPRICLNTSDVIMVYMRAECFFCFLLSHYFSCVRNDWRGFKNTDREKIVCCVHEQSMCIYIWPQRVNQIVVNSTANS